MINKIPNLAPEKEWYECPKCGQKLLIYESEARCSGIFVRCKRCKKIIEVKIKEH